MYYVYSNKQTCHKSTVWVQGRCLQRKQNWAMKSWDKWCKLRVALFRLQKVKFKLHNVGTKIMVHGINSSPMTLNSEIDEDDLTSKKTFSRISLSCVVIFTLSYCGLVLIYRKMRSLAENFFEQNFLSRLSLKVCCILFSAILLHTANSLSYYHLIDIDFSHYNSTAKIEQLFLLGQSI